MLVGCGNYMCLFVVVFCICLGRVVGVIVGYVDGCGGLFGCVGVLNEFFDCVI